MKEENLSEEERHARRLAKRREWYRKNSDRMHEQKKLYYERLKEREKLDPALKEKRLAAARKRSHRNWLKRMELEKEKPDLRKERLYKNKLMRVRADLRKMEKCKEQTR